MFVISRTYFNKSIFLSIRFRFKDGRSYPWSSEDSSSLIVYPQAANQTIFTRKASKVDEGRYTCVLRNDTHKMEHQMQLKVLGENKDAKLFLFIPSFYRLVFPGRIFNYFPFLIFLALHKFVRRWFSQNFNLISIFIVHRLVTWRSARNILPGKPVCWCRRISSILLWSFCGQERSAWHLHQHSMVSRARRQLSSCYQRWKPRNCETRRRTNHRIVFDDSTSDDESLRTIFVSCRNGKLTNSSARDVSRAHQRSSDRSW